MVCPRYSDSVHLDAAAAVKLRAHFYMMTEWWRDTGRTPTMFSYKRTPYYQITDNSTQLNKVGAVQFGGCGLAREGRGLDNCAQRDGRPVSVCVAIVSELLMR